MPGSRSFLVAFAIAACLASAGTAAAYHTRFVEWNVLVRTQARLS
jgi:hypothetical protein